MSLSPFLPGKTSKPPGTPPPYRCHPLCSVLGTSFCTQDITHKIQRPCRIGLRWLSQRCLDTCWKAFLQTDTFLVVHILVYTVNLLVFPLLSFTPETFEYLPETLYVLGCRPYRFFHFSVISPFLIIVIRTVDLHQLAHPSDAQFVFLYNLYCYLFLYLGVKCNRACRGLFRPKGL